MSSLSVPRVEFHFDFGSSSAYLAHLVIPEIEARTGVRVDYVPVLLGAVLKATGIAPLLPGHGSAGNYGAGIESGAANRVEYAALEARRFVTRYELESRFRRNPHFPVDTLRIMRGAVAARRLGPEVFGRYVGAMFEAMWRYPRKMDEPEVITETLRAAGLPAGELVAGMRDPDVKAELRAITEDAVARGVFGSPSFFVGPELFFGKDRLGDVEQEITARTAMCGAARACC